MIPHPVRLLKKKKQNQPILLAGSTSSTIFVKLTYEYMNKWLAVRVFIDMTTYSGMLM